ATVLGYDAMTGSVRFREQLGSFMGRTFLGREFGPEQISVLAGAGSVLEILFYALGDPGDGILVPTPSYAGFWLDLEVRDGLTIVPVHRSIDDGYRLTSEMLDRALAGAGRPIKALLFTSLVLSSGFFLYMLASMNNLFDFGLLTGFTIIAAFLADLILAPALMVLVIRPRGVEVAAALEMETSR
ncbi:MAG: aminotransferase class I/II-fold pyridoxal phosphate-dependent enzyme, partial [Acidimicrobiales bacterium]